MALTLALCVAVASAAAPTVTISPPLPGITSVRFSGSVNPEGQATSWRFQYATQADFSDAVNGPEGTLSAKAPPFEWSLSSKSITGLQPETIYYLRLLAENADGKSEAVASSFETLGPAAPQVGSTFVTLVDETEATLNAGIDPSGLDTTYHFEYVDQVAYEASEFDTATSTPDQVMDGFAAPGTVASAAISELQPATTYRYRVLIENAKGEAEGDVHAFHTFKEDEASEDTCPNAARRSELHATRLPDCRAYEMVSPLAKNGGYVLAHSSRTQVSADGDSVVFSSLASFADPKASSFSNQYLAHRTAEAGTNGWSTHSITPQSGTGILNSATNGDNTPRYVGAYTPDLSAGIYTAWRSMVGPSNVDTVSNLYRIDGLEDQSLTPTLLTDSYKALPSFPEIGGYNYEEEKLRLRPTILGASEDLSHVLFESPVNLTPDAPAQAFPCEVAGLFCQSRLYENANGEVRFVARIPKAPAIGCDDEAPAEDEVACEVLDGGGSPIGSEAYPAKMISADGSRIFFTSGGNTYLREDGERTIQLNVSEDGSPEFGGAEIWDATPDGSRVFFSTEEQLLPSDNDGSHADLYMYEVEKPAGERLTLVSEGTSGNDGNFQGMVGASDDGHYAYFGFGGQLIAGESGTSFAGLYAWHDGTLSYIGSFESVGGILSNSPSTGSAGDSTAKKSRITPDGRHLLFMSPGDAGFRGRGGFTSYDHNGKDEFYLYDADTGHLACASCNPSGEAATGKATNFVRSDTGAASHTRHLPNALSDDGRFVFFNSPEALVPSDTNGAEDAYRYDSQSEEISLISTGTSSKASFFIEASKDGRDVFFTTAQQLSARDTDSTYDLYDARIDGGMPEPPPITASCNGDSCLHASPPAPPVAAVASTSAGQGNPKTRCPGKARAVRKGGALRCLKPRKHKKAHKRHANANRRAAK